MSIVGGRCDPLDIVDTIIDQRCFLSSRNWLTLWLNCDPKGQFYDTLFDVPSLLRQSFLFLLLLLLYLSTHTNENVTVLKTNTNSMENMKIACTAWR